ncbi:hypothetical protein [Fluviicola taffensis]|uniref:hypothetical protein n=1 Tax=Fluviicola taffensis TaxID=191579 RepID=UPI0031378CC6
MEREYKKVTLTEFNGLPSDVAINSISQYISSRSKADFLSEVPEIIKSRKTSLERQIYSTYKAASYYVNLAKDKFELINNRNELTPHGELLLKMRSSFFSLSKKEVEFYFCRLLEADFHLFITHCLFIRLEKKYSLKNTIRDQIDFINEFLEIKHFNFTSSSLSNYNVVRSYWVQSLNVVDVKGNIRKNFIEIIKNQPKFSILFDELKKLFSIFEKENFKMKKTYLLRKQKFHDIYRSYVSTNVSDQGFVNLYDIKKGLRISPENFQKLLIEFYESEKKTFHIFFDNTVNSIDRNERFFIRNRPVIKIKIKQQ